MKNKIPGTPGILYYPSDKNLKTVIAEKGRDEAIRLFGEYIVLFYEAMESTKGKKNE